jgi:hypothetical protein
MSFDGTGLGLEGRDKVHGAWRAILNGRSCGRRDDLDYARMIGELAHVSIVAREADGFRFRLAGSGLRHAFEQEARGLLVSDIAACKGQSAWDEGLRRALSDGRPVMGRSRTASGMIHYWMRLPLSSDGVTVDQVLCHDRVLPAESMQDPDRAARAADRAMRLDAAELRAA